MNPTETTALAFAAARGDADATAAFVRATQATVWRYVAYLADPQAADDLTQETYVRALRALRSFRGDADARIWLLAIAHRTVADHHRRQRRRSRIAADAAAGTETSAPDHADAVALQHLVRRLDQDRRAAFVLTQMLGLSYEEAAAACEVPVGTIRSRVSRARGDLISAIEAGVGQTPPMPMDVDARRRSRRTTT